MLKMAAQDIPRFELYYSPRSYFSRRVLLALYEKGEDFRGTIVNARQGDVMERWFMLINPLGQVPVLKDGDLILPESENIIDYIDKQVTREPQLVPSMETEFGKNVNMFRKLLIREAHITYGIWYNPELSPGDARSPWTKTEWEDHLTQTLAKLTKYAEENPDLREAYNRKMDFLKARMKFARDVAQVQAEIDSLHPVFDQVEEQLIKIKKECDGESWLCGSTFTVADISLTELLNRLTRIGLGSMYFSPEKRSAIYQYWQQAQKRSSFVKIKEHEQII